MSQQNNIEWVPKSCFQPNLRKYKAPALVSSSGTFIFIYNSNIRYETTVNKSSTQRYCTYVRTYISKVIATMKFEIEISVEKEKMLISYSKFRFGLLLLVKLNRNEQFPILHKWMHSSWNVQTLFYWWNEKSFLKKSAKKKNTIDFNFVRHRPDHRNVDTI